MSLPIPWVLHPLPLVQGEPLRMARDTQLPLATSNECMNQRLENKLKIPKPQWADSENSWTAYGLIIECIMQNNGVKPPLFLLFLLCCRLPPKLGETAKVYR